MRTRLAIRAHAILERFFPERRLFLRSDTDTRFIRLKPSTQLIAFVGSSAIVAWAIIATAILLMDSIGSGNFREQAKRDQLTYEHRLNDLSSQRDTRTEEALAAQARFNSALTQISDMQSELLASEIRRKELETGIEVIQPRCAGPCRNAKLHGPRLLPAIRHRPKPKPRSLAHRRLATTCLTCCRPPQRDRR